jgi:DNA-directed RNA polymerase subunit H (RpoH/RPB5)|tara:strand:- start:4004 stop:4633 length:630 start_codon:yes stop_codon:yes gene_type:complete
MSLVNSNIENIYKSRCNILDILKYRGFDISSYENFTINEINILNNNNQLDILVKNNTTNKNVYVKYYLNKLLKAQTIYSSIEDLFNIDNILTKNDDLIIIIKDEPNENLNQIIRDIWMEDEYYISILNINRLQYNILNHSLVPKHIILSDEEATLFKKKYNIIDDSQIADISYFSPISLILGIRPNNIVKIIRNSKTSIESNFYRICKL